MAFYSLHLCLHHSRSLAQSVSWDANPKETGGNPPNGQGTIECKLRFAHIGTGATVKAQAFAAARSTNSKGLLYHSTNQSVTITDGNGMITLTISNNGNKLPNDGYDVWTVTTINGGTGDNFMTPAEPLKLVQINSGQGAHAARKTMPHISPNGNEVMKVSGSGDFMFPIGSEYSYKVSAFPKLGGYIKNAPSIVYQDIMNSNGQVIGKNYTFDYNLTVPGDYIMIGTNHVNDGSVQLVISETPTISVKPPPKN